MSAPELVPQARLSGPMPWVIAIMVAMTVIAVAAGLTLRNTVRSAQRELAGGLTVQVIEAQADKRAAQTVAAVARLRGMPGVTSVRQVPQAELDALVEPWLGAAGPGESDAAIPVPTLIDVQLAGRVDGGRIAAVRQALRGVAPAARVDAQTAWLEPVYAAIESLQWLAASLVVLLALALAAAVLLASRSALGANRDTIEIVHLLGGTDSQIARAFQRSTGIDAICGGVVGLLLALVVILALGRRFAELGAGLVDRGALAWEDWLVLALVPLLAAMLAMLTARLTVMRALRKML